MICHAFMKICAFFCAGAIIYKTGKNYIFELNGFGRKMPKVFIAFTVSGLALMGVPGLCGFIGKWNLAEAAVASEEPLAWIGVPALLISAILTAIYMLSVSVRAFFPGRNFDYQTISNVKDPNWLMTLPLAVFVIVMLVLGLHSQPLLGIFEAVASAVG